jgi:hypothetical protein
MTKESMMRSRTLSMWIVAALGVTACTPQPAVDHDTQHATSRPSPFAAVSYDYRFVVEDLDLPAGASDQHCTASLELGAGAPTMATEPARPDSNLDGGGVVFEGTLAMPRYRDEVPAELTLLCADGSHNVVELSFAGFGGLKVGADADATGEVVRSTIEGHDTFAAQTTVALNLHARHVAPAPAIDASNCEAGEDGADEMFVRLWVRSPQELGEAFLPPYGDDWVGSLELDNGALEADYFPRKDEPSETVLRYCRDADPNAEVRIKVGLFEDDLIADDNYWSEYFVLRRGDLAQGALEHDKSDAGSIAYQKVAQVLVEVQ